MVSLLLLLAILQAPTVNVSGTVVDARTGAPLAHVLVTVEGTALATHTDADGRFALAVAPGRRTLFVSVIGYALARRELTVEAAPVELTIPLAEGTGTYVETITVQAETFR